jgi:hypothetical protein
MRLLSHPETVAYVPDDPVVDDPHHKFPSDGVIQSDGLVELVMKFEVPAAATADRGQAVVETLPAFENEIFLHH